jgi:murein DD-endopeptidase MepM/ murein hydrolase activator NlpD
VCAAVFVLAVAVKLVFPDFVAAIGEKIGASVDYKAALEAIGEGLSGEKRFTEALGEAWTIAFRSEPPKTEVQGVPEVSETPASAEAFAPAPEVTPKAEVTPAPEDAPKAFSDAVIAAFMESQQTYSDYAIPAGASYDMPVLGIVCKSPADGVVSSGFGYRTHPDDGQVKFHYGVDVAAPRGAAVSAFADGVVAAVGESTTLGNYVIVSHGEVETKYAHCDEVFVAGGQAVTAGEKIAAVGDSGNATGECLHFELKINGVNVNPAYYVTWL